MKSKRPNPLKTSKSPLNVLRNKSITSGGGPTTSSTSTSSEASDSPNHHMHNIDMSMRRTSRSKTTHNTSNITTTTRKKKQFQIHEDNDDMAFEDNTTDNTHHYNHNHNQQRNNRGGKRQQGHGNGPRRIPLSTADSDDNEDEGSAHINITDWNTGYEGDEGSNGGEIDGEYSLDSFSISGGEGESESRRHSKLTTDFSSYGATANPHRVSSSQQAELTRIEREIRIYTIESHTPLDADDPSRFDQSASDILSQMGVPGVSTYVATPRESECRSFHNGRAEIKCWLAMELRVLVIRVKVPDAFPLIDVKAQVSLRDIALNKGVSVDNLIGDLKTLEVIATELSTEVELTVEDDSATNGSAALLKRQQSKQKSAESGKSTTGKAPKATRTTRLVVHMAKKGRKRHRNISQAFLDEHFASSLSLVNGDVDTRWTKRTEAPSSIDAIESKYANMLLFFYPP